MVKIKHYLFIVFVVVTASGCALYKLNTVDLTDYTERRWRPVGQNQNVYTHKGSTSASDEQPVQNSNSIMDIQEEIKKLDTMKKNGLVNEAEYQSLKNKIINSY